MQAQGMQAEDGNSGTNGFISPKHYRHSSQDSISFSTHASGKNELQFSHGRSGLDPGSSHATSVPSDAPPNNSFAQSSDESLALPPANAMSWNSTGSHVSSESKDNSKSDYGPYRSAADTDKKSHQKPPPPPRLPGYGRTRPDDVHLTSLSPTSNHTIPSPLASPITATANSLTALSISHTSTHGTFSGRDLSKVIVPRERKQTRPYSISSTDALLAQERKRNGQDEDSIQDQSGRLSDPETTRRLGLGTPKSRTKTETKVELGSSTTPTQIPSTPSAVSNSGKPADLKSPTLKPTVQLRVNLYNLVSTGYLPADTLAIFREHSAIVTAKGTLIPQYKDAESASLYPWLQNEYETPSAWATAMVKGGRTGKVAVNGWSAIKIPIQRVPELSKMFEGQGLTEVSLDVLRKRYLADMTEDGSQPEGSSTQSSKGTAALDRKKRKRHGPASADSPSLTISTPSVTVGQKTRSSTTRPRKRTVSDLSGMVISDIMEDRQLHLEAAGALFSMQDPFSSPTQNRHTHHGSTKGDGYRQKPTWRKHSILLESLAQYRHEKESAWSHSSATRLSALRVVKAISMAATVAPLGLGLSKEDVAFCTLCGAAGEITGPLHHHHTSTLRTTRPSRNSSLKAEARDAVVDLESYSDHDTMKRCLDCGDCYHLDCVPAEARAERHPSLSSEDVTKCPRCTICKSCEKSIYQTPVVLVGEATLEPTTATSPTTAEGGTMEKFEDIQVLSCSKCGEFNHLQCQMIREPMLKNALETNKSRGYVEWICLDCRECVECGHRPMASVSTLAAATISAAPKTASISAMASATTTTTDVDMSLEDSKNITESKKRSDTEGHWSNGYALCPSCTVLAEKGNICPLCCRIYQDDDYETPMIFCDGCSLWVHVACDKGLQDRDYEELGEDSKQYFCPSCIPTPIPSPTHSSSSSSVFSAVNSVEQSPWQGPYGYGQHQSEGSANDYSREASSGNEEDWQHYHYHPVNSRKRKDDIMDLIKAAQEISDSESRANSPYSNYSPMFPSSSSSSSLPMSMSMHSRTLSTSLESVAEVAAAEALLTIFSGASTPVSSTPYTSYPPSPFEPSFTGPFDRHYSVINSPQELPPLMRSMVAFTPPPSSSELESSSSVSAILTHTRSRSQSQDCQGVPSCRCQRHRDIAHVEDYFNSRPYPHPNPRRRSVSVSVSASASTSVAVAAAAASGTAAVPYHQIGQELPGIGSSKQQHTQMAAVDSADIDMKEAKAGVEQSTLGNLMPPPPLLPAEIVANSETVATVAAVQR